MSREETSELRAFIKQKSDAAVQITNAKSPVDHPEKPRTVWIPRSLIGRTTTLRNADPSKPDTAHLHDNITFQLPDWKIEQDSLWEFVP